MSTIPTQNPVPSEAAKDLKFNSGKIDEFVTSMKKKYIDRFGREHFTIEGLRWIAQQAISQFGYITLESFQKGAEITLPNQVLRDEVTGEYYRWDGEFPKSIPVNSTPDNSGGVGSGKWLSIGDASLKSNLLKMDGLSYIGSANYDDIRNYSGDRDRAYVYGRSSVFDGANGEFFVDNEDRASEDNDGTVLVDLKGRRWKRVYNGKLNGLWFGMDRNGVLSSSVQFNKLLSSGVDIIIPSGSYLLSGEHNLKNGQSIYFDNVEIKSDGSASENSMLIINNDDITISGKLTINGEKIDKSLEYPKIAIGIRIGSERQVNGVNISGVHFFAVTYGLFVTGARNSHISNCKASLCSDGFRMASNASGVAESFGLENFNFKSCTASNNGITFMPDSGTISTESCCGFKITDIPIKNLTFENCISELNCGFGFNIHGHKYLSKPDDFIIDNIKFINCIASKNNVPEDNLPEDQTPPTGLCSGFYIGLIGSDISNVLIDNCSSNGNVGDAVHIRSLDDVSTLRGLSVNNISMTGVVRSKNSKIRSENSLLRISSVHNLRISGINILDVAGRYDFIIYSRNLTGNVSLCGVVNGDSPNLMYAQSSSSGYVNKISISNLRYIKGANLNPASTTTPIAIRVIDFDEVLIDGISISDTLIGDLSLHYGIKQESPLRESKSIKVINSVISGTNTSSKIKGSAVDISSKGGSKSFVSNTLSNSDTGISGNQSENAIFIGNHFVTGTVTTQVRNFAPSAIKVGNFGLPNS